MSITVYKRVKGIHKKSEKGVGVLREGVIEIKV